MSNIDARDGTVSFVHGNQINAGIVHFGTPVGAVADEIERRIASSITAALSGVRFVYDATSQVSIFNYTPRPILIRMKLIQINENQAEIRRVAARLEHIIVALEDSKRRQVNEPQEYADALVAISQ